ncbi:MAG: AbrB/MazE/SpoVT family DNA-binding domain-containing protein [Peptococcaceae bacterium]|jgi:AbrB family looped-hinge helix DNA binding protein|nr:AbrB/MazE/SpoVT family DNA-binding domain-containing protein [Peptococcaceae bacterium]
MEMAKVTAKGQITVPAPVRRRLGLNEGSSMLFIEQGNGFFVVNENLVDINLLRAATAKTPPNRWSEAYAAAVAAFCETADSTFVGPADIAWTDRGELF